MVYNGKCAVGLQVVEAEFVLVAEVPYSEGQAEAAGSVLPTFVSAVKVYHLHVQRGEKGADNAFVNAELLTHYADTPFEALYCGFFLEEAAVRAYVSMYDGGPAYAQEARQQNERVLAEKVTENFKVGAALIAAPLRLLLRLIATLATLAYAARGAWNGCIHRNDLDPVQASSWTACSVSRSTACSQDAVTVQQPLLDDASLAPLEELTAHAATPGRTSTVAVLPDILRVMHSAVCQLARVVDSLRCLAVLLSRAHTIKAFTAAVDSSTEVVEGTLEQHVDVGTLQVRFGSSQLVACQSCVITCSRFGMVPTDCSPSLRNSPRHTNFTRRWLSCLRSCCASLTGP